MPHLVLEYSSNIKEKDAFDSLFAQLHQILAKVGNASLESCKSRAIEYETFYIGDGNHKNAFVHLEVRLAEGRPLKIRQQIGEHMLDVLELHFSQSLRDLNLQITVESKELIKNLYFKIPRGTV